MAEPPRFTMTFTARPEHIDENGHVNNAVWVAWVQDVAGAHWHEAGRAEDVAAFGWLVTRHEIDYRGNVGVGETVVATSWIDPEKTGVRCDRLIVFRKAGEDRPLVEARSTWVMLNRETGRITRPRAEMLAPFLPY